MPSFQLSQNLVQSLRQEQIMAPHQIQALEILLATIPELEQRISAELAENPTLELLEQAGLSLSGNPTEETVAERPPEAAAEAVDKDETLATLIALQEDWQDHTPPRSGTSSYSEEDLERRQHFFDSLSSEGTLQEHLLTQLRELDGFDDDIIKICREVIGSIDDTGYLRTHPADLAITTNADIEEVDRAIAIVQTFDPPGIGARDLRECLLLQLDRCGDRGTLSWVLVNEHLEDVGRNRIPQLSKTLDEEPDAIYAAIRRLRKFSPYPGNRFSSNLNDYVYPEVFIEKDEKGEWEVRANRDYQPRLRISPMYMKMLEDPNTPEDAKKYIKEKITGSNMLLRAIEQRESTIVRIARSILDRQKDYFELGKDKLHPMIMNQVAEDIGVHETTVSRAIANKYMQSPQGLVPFRQFFSGGYRGIDGSEVSAVGIKGKIDELIRGEDRRKPLSDQKIANELKKSGFKVARRTVAKYREELGIPATSLRRSYE